MALSAGQTVRRIDVAELQRRLHAVGADPGDVPAANARVAEQVA
jgi:hypothetical protein